MPKNIFVGQQLAFDMYISGRLEGSSALVEPEIRLKSCTVLLIAHTTGKERAAPQDSSNIEVSMKRGVTFTPSGPFSPGREGAKLVMAGSLSQVPSSFTHAGVQRSYTLRIASSLAVASRVISHMRDFKVVVHPPCLQDGELNSMSGSINLARDGIANDEQPPAYEEAVAGSSSRQDLQPSYEEAIEDFSPTDIDSVSPVTSSGA